MKDDRQRELREKALKGGTRHLAKLREQNKLTARERLDILLDKDSFIEDGLFANVLAEDLPADGVVTGLGTIEGRQVAIMANDPTVKAGSWGARTVEKIVRVQETAARLRIPLFYLVDSAGARITDMPGGSSMTRSSSRGRCRKSVSCSARRRPAAPTFPLSATWS
jgi:acetyl-CoA carboxylase carboxyltransferase component